MEDPPSFSSLDSVVVPPGENNGSSFVVRLPVKKQGDTVYKQRRLWRGCGCWPALNERSLRAAGSRKGCTRPASRAGYGKRAIDTLASVPNGIAFGETEELMPFEVSEADAGWRAGPVGGAAGRRGALARAGRLCRGGPARKARG